MSLLPVNKRREEKRREEEERGGGRDMHAHTSYLEGGEGESGAGQDSSTSQGIAGGRALLVVDSVGVEVPHQVPHAAQVVVHQREGHAELHQRTRAGVTHTLHDSAHVTAGEGNDTHAGHADGEKASGDSVGDGGDGGSRPGVLEDMGGDGAACMHGGGGETDREERELINKCLGMSD
jgi:hypothetical protein